MSIENLIFRALERFWSARYAERYGVVTSYDPKKHAAKVKIQPGGQETGWIPIHAHHIGNGWGILVGLTAGDQVKLSHQEGDFDVGEITNRVHSDEDKPPEVQSGEMLLKHKKAGSIFWDKDENVTWSGANGQVIKTDKKGNTSITLKVSEKKKSDDKSPTLTMTLEDQNGKKHSVTLNKDGINHNSEVKVTIKADKIEHDGNLKVTGSIKASKVIESEKGIKGPIVGGAPGDPGGAESW